MNRPFKPLLIFWVIFFLLNVKYTFAYPIQQLEQQVGLTTAEVSTSSLTSVPTDNSLGLFLYTASNYPSASIYLDVTLHCASCTGGNSAALVALYDSSGNQVTQSQITTTSSTYIHLRSQNLSSYLVDNTQYTARLLLDATTGTAFLKTAKLVIIQTSASINTTTSMIELGNTDLTSSATYELIAAPKIYFYDTDNISDIDAVYLEATLKNDSVSSHAYAALSSSTTCASTITDSEVGVVGTTWTRVRSADIKSNLVDDTDYWVCVRSENNDLAEYSSVKLIIRQNNAQGLSKIELLHPFANTAVSDSDSGYTSQNFLYLHDFSLPIANDIYQYFDATLKTSSLTSPAYARLYDASSSANIVNSELNTTSTGYTRLRTSDLRSVLPTTVKTLDLQLKNDSTDTTTLSGAWLITHLVRTPDAALSFSLGSIEANAVSNGITTSVTSSYNNIPFGHLSFNTPKYVAQALFATTNSSSGYTVFVEMQNYLQGLYPSNNIDPFIHSWESPAAWTEPNGTTPNDNTGWFGANTTDSRVSGWANSEGKFGAITSGGQIVMQSTTADPGSTANVTYALEVNISQPSDQYQGTLTYTIIPSY